MTRPIPKLAGVCGWPIHHSLSPQMHSFWLREMGLAGAYVHFAVRPDEAVRAFQSLKQTSIAGVNVTLPLKELAYEAADIVTDDAKKLGVANCLYKRDGQLIAHNTDLEGFATPLIRALGPRTIANTPVIIYGTGGASRAVIGALLSLNCPEIRLCGRTDNRAEAVVDDFNVPSLYAVPWAMRHDGIGGAGVIINASAAGMKGYPALDVDLTLASPGALVYDLIYTPEVTPLLKAAKSQGLPSIGGLDMLIAQARPSFKLFFGQTPPETLDPTDLLRKTLNS
ncbi:shikimate dehydrogenase [Fretibacter rubidus]|uniref:shikimate dehydrogenase family protein n=1 Tax=Fretibacter rubidus TaxID=570162 RepID=UPI003529FEB2